MSVTAQQDTRDAGGCFTCRQEHRLVCEQVCNDLGGGLSTNPDGSITCCFTLPSPSSGSGEPQGRFKCDADDAVPCGDICRQLGGTLDHDASGSTACRFHLPQEPQWSIVPIAEDTVRVRFDVETFYTFSVRSPETCLRVFRSGRQIEELSGVVSRTEHSLKTIGSGSDGSTAVMTTSGGAECLNTSYTLDGRTIFGIESAAAAHGQLLARELSRIVMLQPDLGYSNLFVDRVVRNASFLDRLQLMTGTDTPAKGGNTVNKICIAVCAACGLTGNGLACLSWMACVFANPPS